MKAWGVTLPPDGTASHTVKAYDLRLRRSADALTACADRVRQLERALAAANGRIAELEQIEAQFIALNAALDDLLVLEARSAMPGGAGRRGASS